MLGHDMSKPRVFKVASGSWCCASGVLRPMTLGVLTVARLGETPSAAFIRWRASVASVASSSDVHLPAGRDVVRELKLNF